MLRTQFLSELDAVRNNLLQMGETAIALCNEALHAIAEPTRGPSPRASELEARTDHLHRLIHDQCLSLITLQAPVARDARLLTGILDAIVDLELIGDYAYEVVTLSSGLTRKPPSQVLNYIADAGGKIRDVLIAAMESWHTADRAQAQAVCLAATPIRIECDAVYEKVSQLVASPGEGVAYVDLMIICKHLERVLRHAVCVADQAAEAAPSAAVA